MTDNEKQFVENWKYYHDKGKWQFILLNGIPIGAAAHILFALIKFFISEALSWDTFKAFFFSSAFMAEWSLSALLIGLMLGYVIWRLSDIHFRGLMNKMEEDK